MSLAAAEAPLHEGYDLIFVGYDPSTGDYAALEVVPSTWHTSRFTPAPFKRRSKSRKTNRETKAARSASEPDLTSSAAQVVRDPSDLSHPEVLSSPLHLAGTSSSSPGAPLQSVADIASDADPDGSPSKPSKGPPTGGGKRGKISKFTRAQQRRLREHIWAAGPSLLPRRLPDGKTHYPASFIGLTYPGHCAWDDRFLDAHVCKRHLRAFWRRLERRHPGAWTIWVLELQRRSDTSLPPAWHFHLVLRWPDSQGETRDGWRERNRWLSENWAQVVAAGPHADRGHLDSGVNSRKIASVNTVRRYVLKGGSKISIAQWERYGSPFWPSQEQTRLFSERVKHVQNAVRRLAISPNPGAWWRPLGYRAYRQSCSVFACRVPKHLHDRVRASVARSWLRYHGPRIKRGQYTPPRWISGRYAELALREAGTTAYRLLRGQDGGEIVDVNTGQSVDFAQPDRGDAVE